MHDRNRKSILTEILRGARITRQDIKERTGLTHATVSRITRDFIEAGLMREGDKVIDLGAKGRRRVEFKINADAGFVVGICLSAFQKAVSIVDVEGRQRYRESIPEDVIDDPEGTVEFIGGIIDRWIAESDLPGVRILGAGVVVAGSVDHFAGDIVEAPLLRWTNVPIRTLLSDRLKLEVVVQNVADGLCLACLDRLYREAAARFHMFLVHVAVGMGASLMIDRRAVRRRGDEAWISRIPVVLTGKCAGNDGRLGDVVSGKAILSTLDELEHGVDDVRASDPITVRLENAVRAANTGSQAATRTFLEAGRLLGQVLGLLTASYRPDVLILAGPVALAEPFRQGVEEGYREFWSLIDDSPIDVVMNPMTYLDAAENLGLREFLVPGLLSAIQEY
jgi:predicted NBD/HSP70 family sugar kinase